MSKCDFVCFLLAVGMGAVVLSAGSVSYAQEAATPEVRAGTQPVPKKPPTLKQLARMVATLQKENAALKNRIVSLESRLQALEAGPNLSDLEKRVRVLEQSGMPDVHRALGLRAGQTLELWHRDIHRTDSRVRFPTERDFEDWHLRDHQRRGAILRR